MLSNGRKYTLFLLIPLLFSCAREESHPLIPEKAPETRTAMEDDIPGMIRIRTGRELSDSEIEALRPDYTLTRTFPPAGKFEERHRAAGLHLWYDVRFDPQRPQTRAAEDLTALLDIRETENIPAATPAEVRWPFNDPASASYWNYWNDGSRPGARVGSDIRILPAWEITTGRPEVIVAVNDSGVLYTHEDLSRNMWFNERELHGTPGVDDDGNGYVDDIYGYNFCYDGASVLIGEIEPADHGTHVAGTIAAVNNNGIGGCGIAGGDGTSGSGVRIMSTQTISGNSNAPSSFIYAADMGALLINCSWSYSNRETPPSSFVTAVNYFNQYAGMDTDGRQTGLMKGGLIIFAAGNNQKDTSCPAMEDNVFAVAAVGGDYVKAYYSNYGDWVDISAPGGDSQKGFRIYSSITGNGYDYKQGTSMAAPHVTGVAALVVSHFGGPGFTRKDLIRILQNSSDPRIYDYNPAYTGKLGSGLVDATSALTGGGDEPAHENRRPVIKPLDGTTLTLSASGTGRLRFELSDPDRDPLTYTLSVNTPGVSDLLNGSAQTSGGTGQAPSGSTLTLTFDALLMDEGKTYDGTLSVSDGQDTATVSFQYTVRKNNPPAVLREIDDRILPLKSSGYVTIDLRDYIADTDQESLLYELSAEPASPSVHGGITGSILYLRPEMAGETRFRIRATDGRKASVETSLRVLVRDTSRPVDLFPNPVQDVLTVRPGTDTETGVRILSATGRVLLQLAPTPAGPFQPLTMDLSALPAGRYTVLLDGDGLQGSYPIVKR